MGVEGNSCSTKEKYTAVKYCVYLVRALVTPAVTLPSPLQMYGITTMQVRPLPHPYREQIWCPQWMGVMGTYALSVTNSMPSERLHVYSSNYA